MSKEEEKRCVCLFRAEEVAKSMTNCIQDGCGIHERENIRQGAEMLIHLLNTLPEDSCVDSELMGVLQSLEKRSLNYFKKRFGPAWH